jgi:hypothetical protein
VLAQITSSGGRATSDEQNHARIALNSVFTTRRKKERKEK